MTIGKKIASLRAEKDVSQVKLAEDIGVSRSLLYKWESDSVTPSNKSVQKLSEYFGVPYSYFYDDIPESAPSDAASDGAEEATDSSEAESLSEKDIAHEQAVAELKKIIEDYSQKDDVTKTGLKELLENVFKKEFVIHKRIVLIILSVLSVISATATVYFGATIFPLEAEADKVGNVPVLLIVFICAVAITLGLIIAAVCVKVLWKWKSLL